VAETDAPVLILGETGSGKEMAAQLIHRKSRRVDKEFVAIDCTQFTEERFASELFGHLRGAFTGAVENKMGLFELADRGTLFLDEIGELSLSIQAKLLRTLETGSFRRLGETRERHADVRLVCATNRDIKDMVKQGAFRADLYYRINCMQVELPPLRHRGGDLPELVNYFLERARPSHRHQRGRLRGLAGLPVPGQHARIAQYPGAGHGHVQGRPAGGPAPAGGGHAQGTARRKSIRFTRWAISSHASTTVIRTATTCWRCWPSIAAIAAWPPRSSALPSARYIASSKRLPMPDGS
jgi:hypothetical protein